MKHLHTYKEFKLFEVTDVLMLPNDPFPDKMVFFTHISAIPFFYYKNKLVVGDNGVSHGHMAEDIADSEKIDLGSDEIWGEIEWQGRVFTKDKIISFWEIPDTRTFKHILYDLQEYFSEDLKGEFKLELIRDENISKEEFDKYPDIEEFEKAKSRIKFLPIELYVNNYSKPKNYPLAYKQAILSEDNKNK